MYSAIIHIMARLSVETYIPELDGWVEESAMKGLHAGTELFGGSGGIKIQILGKKNDRRNAQQAG